MNIWQSSLEKALSENEINVNFYRSRKKSYEELLKNLNYYNENLSPSIMVPFCNRIMMKGNLIHTNEVLVCLGCNYFVKTSSKQAEDICRRRIINTEAMLCDLEKETKFLSDQMDFSKENITFHNNKEIVEAYDDENEKQWRIKHKENLKIERQKERKLRNQLNGDDFNKVLDILELKEEIEMLEQDKSTKKTLIENDIKKLSNLKKNTKNENTEDKNVTIKLNQLENDFELKYILEKSEDILFKGNIENSKTENICRKEKNMDSIDYVNDGNSYALQQSVVQSLIKPVALEEKTFQSDMSSFRSKKNVICKKIAELKNKKSNYVSDEDLIKRLDELEEQEELENDLEKLYDEYSINYPEETDDYYEVSNDSTVTSDDNDDAKNQITTSKPTDHNGVSKTKKRVSFSDFSNELTANTISINFSHSEVLNHYINKTSSIFETPSDIYKSFPKYFEKKPKSIIKSNNNVKSEKPNKLDIEKSDSNINARSSESVIIGNIVEHNTEAFSVQNNLSQTSEEKSISKFKSMRIAKKKLNIP